MIERRTAGQRRTWTPESLSNRVIGAYYEVFNTLPKGLPERAYSRGFGVEMQLRGMQAVREHPVHVVYKGVEIGTYRLDFLVENRLVVELKSQAELTRGDIKQVKQYLAASGLRVALLFKFGSEAEFLRITNGEDDVTI